MPGSANQDGVKLVVLDWAGTTVDHGCFSPLTPFIESLRRYGVEITVEQARGPMGMHKRDHLQALLNLPEVTAAWRQRWGRAPDDVDLDRVFQRDFMPLQIECVADASRLITGLLETVDWLRGRGIRIGTTTGYIGEAAERCFQAGRDQGYLPDVNVCGSDVPAARPAPWMIYQVMQTLDVYPPSAVVKVGDTIPDIGEGINAGVWSIGVSRTGSEVGLREAELEALAPDERKRRIDAASRRLLDAGAHAVIESIADLPGMIEEIERRISRGEKP